MKPNLADLPTEQKEQLHALLKEREERLRYNKLDTWNDKAYPWQKELAYATKKNAQIMAMCANQTGKCLSVSTSIQTEDGLRKLYSVFGKEIRVPTYPDGELKRVISWVRKPPEECFRVVMKDGQWFESPKGHRVLTSNGFLSLGELFSSLPDSVFRAQDRRQSALQGVRRLCGKVRGYLYRYLVDSHLSGGRLLSGQDSVQVFSPSQAGAPEHNSLLSPKDAPLYKYIYTPSALLRRLPSLGDALQTLARYVSCLTQAPCTYYQSFVYDNQSGQQSYIAPHLPLQDASTHHGQYQSSSFVIPSIGGNEIVSVYSVGVHTLYDMEVEDNHNYIAAGVVHHNTSSGAWITAIHLTGRYPQDWKGHRFKKPIKAWACGVSNDTVRDILQANLLGEPGDPESKGTGFIPKDDIVDVVRKPQVPNAYQAITVKFHGSDGRVIGSSKLDFKSYEQGETKFMGRPMDWIWLDEQPDDNIYTQCITRTVATNGLTMMTFTPEDGINSTIHQFLNDIKPGQQLIQATWEDVTHLSKERKEQLLAQYTPHERKLRSMGIPVFGSGLVFPVPDDDIMVEPFEIPDHWPRLIGIDFGWDHPTAAVWMAWDREADKTYIYNEYRQKERTAEHHALAIRGSGSWIPVVWPHDGIVHDKGSGAGLAMQYRSAGLKMTHDHFRNPIGPGQKGKGDIKVEPGINALLQNMEKGTFKVFSTCPQWFEEKALYHRDDGKIVALKDDLMSATRYAFQCRNRGKTKTESAVFNNYSGMSLPVQTAGIV